MKLLDLRTRDGSRYFTSFCQRASWGAICDHTLLLPDAEMINFVSNWPKRTWVDFHYRSYRFVIKTRENAFHFYVCDPLCPDLILYQVGRHFEQLLGETKTNGLSSHSVDDEGAVA